MNSRTLFKSAQKQRGTVRFVVHPTKIPVWVGNARPRELLPRTSIRSGGAHARGSHTGCPLKLRAEPDASVRSREQWNRGCLTPPADWERRPGDGSAGPPGASLLIRRFGACSPVTGGRRGRAADHATLRLTWRWTAANATGPQCRSKAACVSLDFRRSQSNTNPL